MKPQNKEKIITIIKNFLKNMGAERISIFGSFVRGDDTLISDIDIIVKFEETKSLLELVKIERELSKLLERKVHLITEEAINPYLKNIVDKEKKIVYAK